MQSYDKAKISFTILLRFCYDFLASKDTIFRNFVCTNSRKSVTLQKNEKFFKLMKTIREISRLYFPNVGEEYAVRKLKSMIKNCQPLMMRLRQQGYRDGCHYLTSAQEKSIFHFLGDI